MGIHNQLTLMTITDLSTYHPVFLLKRLSTIPFIPGKKKKKTIRSIRPAIGIGEDYDQQHANYNGRWRQLLNDLNQQHSQFYIFKKSYHPWLQLLPNKNPDFFSHPSIVCSKKTPFPPNFSGENTSCGLASDSQKRMSWRIWILGWNGGPWRIKITTAWMSCWYFWSMDYTNPYIFSQVVFFRHVKKVK